VTHAEIFNVVYSYKLATKTIITTQYLETRDC